MATLTPIDDVARRAIEVVKAHNTSLRAWYGVRVTEQPKKHFELVTEYEYPYCGRWRNFSKTEHYAGVYASLAIDADDNARAVISYGDVSGDVQTVPVKAPPGWQFAVFSGGQVCVRARTDSEAIVYIGCDYVFSSERRRVRAECKNARRAAIRCRIKKRRERAQARRSDAARKVAKRKFERSIIRRAKAEKWTFTDKLASAAGIPRGDQNFWQMGAEAGKGRDGEPVFAVTRVLRDCRQPKSKAAARRREFGLKLLRAIYDHLAEIESLKRRMAEYRSMVYWAQLTAGQVVTVARENIADACRAVMPYPSQALVNKIACDVGMRNARAVISYGGAVPVPADEVIELFFNSESAVYLHRIIIHAIEAALISAIQATEFRRRRNRIYADMFRFPGLVIDLNDAASAGFCREGTIAFAREHRLALKGVPAGDLWKLYRAIDDTRILDVLEAAITRASLPQAA